MKAMKSVTKVGKILFANDIGNRTFFVVSRFKDEGPFLGADGTWTAAPDIDAALKYDCSKDAYEDVRNRFKLRSDRVNFFILKVNVLAVIKQSTQYAIEDMFQDVLVGRAKEKLSREEMEALRSHILAEETAKAEAEEDESARNKGKRSVKQAQR